MGVVIVKVLLLSYLWILVQVVSSETEADILNRMISWDIEGSGFENKHIYTYDISISSTVDQYAVWKREMGDKSKFGPVGWSILSPFNYNSSDHRLVTYINNQPYCVELDGSSWTLDKIENELDSKGLVIDIISNRCGKFQFQDNEFLRSSPGGYCVQQKANSDTMVLSATCNWKTAMASCSTPPCPEDELNITAALNTSVAPTTMIVAATTITTTAATTHALDLSSITPSTATTAVPSTSQVILVTPSTATTAVPSTSQVILGDWGLWSACSVTCGIGTTVRSRICSTCVNAETESCDTNITCTTEWSHWYPSNNCSKTCGEGVQSFERICIYQNDGGNCTGNVTKEECCNVTPCPALTTNHAFTIYQTVTRSNCIEACQQNTECSKVGYISTNNNDEQGKCYLKRTDDGCGFVIPVGDPNYEEIEV